MNLVDGTQVSMLVFCAESVCTRFVDLALPPSAELTAEVETELRKQLVEAGRWVEQASS